MAYNSTYTGALTHQAVGRANNPQTTIGDPGSDSNLVSEQAVREELPSIGTELTLSSGVIALPSDKDGRYAVDTEGDAASDDLDSFSGSLSEGRIIVIYPADSARTVVVKSSSSILLNAGTDFTMNNAADCMMLLSKGSNVFVEISRSSNGS